MMDNCNLSELFLRCYSLSDTILSVEALTWGRTNYTYKISTKENIYIVQQLLWENSKKNQERAIECFLRVKHELYRRNSDIVLPNFIVNKQGEHLTFFSGNYYVVQEYIENTWRPFLDPDRAYSAGELVGKLRRDLTHWEPTPKGYWKDKVDMKSYLSIKHEFFLAALPEKRSHPFFSEMQAISPILEESVEYCRKLLPQMPSETGIIHADAKLSNILFRDKKAIGLVDIYSFQSGPYIWEIGQTLRSFASKGQSWKYERSIMEAAAEGYNSALPYDQRITLRQSLSAAAIRTVGTLFRFATDILGKQDRAGVTRGSDLSKEDFDGTLHAFQNIREHLESLA